MDKHRRIHWTPRELSLVAAEYLRVSQRGDSLSKQETFVCAQGVLGPDRRHPKAWAYYSKNWEILGAEISRLKIAQANEPPAPTGAAEAGHAAPPLAATPPPVGDLGAALAPLLALAERLGEAFGRGLARGYLAQLPAASAASPLEVLRHSGEDFLGFDPAEARRNLRECIKLAEGGEKDRKPRVLIVGGRSGTLSELNGLGEKLDLRHVAQDESAGVVKLRAGAADMAVVFGRFCSHAQQASAVAELGRERVVVVSPERGLDGVRQVLEGMVIAMK